MPAGLNLSHIRHRLFEAGAKPCHAQRVLRLWSLALPQGHGKRRPEDVLPLSVRALMPELEAEWQALATLHSRHPAGDGA